MSLISDILCARVVGYDLQINWCMFDDKTSMMYDNESIRMFIRGSYFSRKGFVNGNDFIKDMMIGLHAMQSKK